MKKFNSIITIFFVMLAFSFSGRCQFGRLNIVVIGAHPDDADYKAGGSALHWVKNGHNVLFVSVTNGDAGHHEINGRKLAKRRQKEALEAGKRFGVQYKVLNNADGKLMPTLKNRLEIIRLIREWNADIVIGHRPNDYHPDHRNTSILMQDAAYMVIVPDVATDTPPLRKNPVFLYMEDKFKKPLPFHPDITIDITNSFEQKIYAMSAHESQYFEWLPWTSGSLGEVPKSKNERLKWLAIKRKPVITKKERASLIKWYGKEKGEQVNLAESFEICEYGKQPSEKEIRELLIICEQ